jgi:hypothetical protein
MKPHFKPPRIVTDDKQMTGLDIPAAEHSPTKRSRRASKFKVVGTYNKKLA